MALFRETYDPAKSWSGTHLFYFIFIPGIAV